MADREHLALTHSVVNWHSRATVEMKKISRPPVELSAVRKRTSRFSYFAIRRCRLTDRQRLRGEGRGEGTDRRLDDAGARWAKPSMMATSATES